MQSRIMYIEKKAGELSGPARIGRVSFSRTGKMLYYRTQKFQRINGYKANHIDADTGEEYWISGCKKAGGDRLYAGLIEIDDDVREEYWTTIRGLPKRKDEKVIRCIGKYAK